MRAYDTYQQVTSVFSFLLQPSGIFPYTSFTMVQLYASGETPLRQKAQLGYEELIDLANT